MLWRNILPIIFFVFACLLFCWFTPLFILLYLPILGQISNINNNNDCFVKYHNPGKAMLPDSTQSETVPEAANQPPTSHGASSGSSTKKKMNETSKKKKKRKSEDKTSQSSKKKKLSKEKSHKDKVGIFFYFENLLVSVENAYIQTLNFALEKYWRPGDN